MVYKEKESVTNFVPLKQKDDFVIGILRDISKSANFETTNIYTLEIESAMSNGADVVLDVNVFVDKIGRVFGSTILDQKIDEGDLGKKLRITLIGEIPTAKGTAKNFKVEVDE